MPPLPAFLAPDVFDSLVVRTINLPKGFLVMCNLLVIMANIWLTRTKNAHQISPWFLEQCKLICLIAEDNHKTHGD